MQFPTTKLVAEILEEIKSQMLMNIYSKCRENNQQELDILLEVNLQQLIVFASQRQPFQMPFTGLPLTGMMTASVLSLQRALVRLLQMP